MASIREDIPGSNGAARGAPFDEGRRFTPSFVADASSDADRRATDNRIRDLQERISDLELTCSDEKFQIASSERHRDAIPQHGRGWPLIMVVLLALLTVALEYLPAYLFTQIFSADYNTWRMLTITFTVIPAALAIALGELLHRLREPAQQRAIDMILLVTVACAALVFLAIGYQLRIAYTTALDHGNLDINSWMEAIALTSVAAIGIILTVVSGYYREGLEMLMVRWKLGRLQRNLQTNEAHLKANRRDIERALSSLPSEARAGGESASRIDPEQRPKSSESDPLGTNGP
jgi:cation transport ATPase